MQLLNEELPVTWPAPVIEQRPRVAANPVIQINVRRCVSPITPFTQFVALGHKKVNSVSRTCS